MRAKPFFRKTKIICTLGPASENPEIIRGLLEAGMNVARFNFSHGDHAEHRRRMEMVRKVSKEIGIPVGVLLDTKGPEIRTGLVEGGGKLLFSAGDTVVLTFNGEPCVPGRLSLSYTPLPWEIKAGQHVFIADGLIDLEVNEIRSGEIYTTVVNGGEIGGKKNVNVPGIKTSLPALVEQDYKDIAFGLEMGVDFIAASFIRKPEDVIAVKRIVETSAHKPLVIAKIEDREGLDNIDTILRFADGILIARGDLGVQLPGEEIPLVQKRLIEKCNMHNKIAVTATQMLESMTVNPKPTRAELTDVANAVFDGTDAVMLSGETAGGKYPLESVKVMSRIIQSVESSPEFEERIKKYFKIQSSSTDIPHATAKAAYVMAQEIEAGAILGLTRSGNTARILSMYRPEQLLVAVTPDEKVQSKLLLNWGVYPVIAPETKDADVMIGNGLRAAIDNGYARMQERVVVVAGVPIGTPLVTNMVRVYFLGNILCRGERGYGGRINGRVVRVENAIEARAKLMLTGDEIIVTHELDASFLPYLANIAGYVLSSYSTLPWEKIREENPLCVGIASVPGVMDILTDNQVVTLSGSEKIVYEGLF